MFRLDLQADHVLATTMRVLTNRTIDHRVEGTLHLNLPVDRVPVVNLPDVGDEQEEEIQCTEDPWEAAQINAICFLCEECGVQSTDVETLGAQGQLGTNRSCSGSGWGGLPACSYSQLNLNECY